MFLHASEFPKETNLFHFQEGIDCLLDHTVVTLSGVQLREARRRAGRRAEVRSLRASVLLEHDERESRLNTGFL